MKCVNCEQGVIVVYRNVTFYNKYELKDDTIILGEPIRSRKRVETKVKCDLCRAEYECYISKNNEKIVEVETYYNKPKLKHDYKAKAPKEKYTLEQINYMIDISLQEKNEKEFYRLVKLREKLQQ